MSAFGVPSATRVCIEENKWKERKRRLDLFAAAALTGILSNDAPVPGGLDTVAKVQEFIATLAWEHARAMLDNEPKED